MVWCVVCGVWSSLWCDMSYCLRWSDTTLEKAGSWEETREDWEVCTPFSRQIFLSDKKMDWEDARQGL